ncbi:MAG: hypothetical protein OJF59_003134 [Cytophagales bacterium]|nr:MAG: hypothetical protein OJF59_003134 [Cytophagales bacterium]
MAKINLCTKLYITHLKQILHLLECFSSFTIRLYLTGSD